MWHGKFPYLSLVAPPLVTHREIFFPTRGFATRWGKIHTTFLLSGGMRHNLLSFVTIMCRNDELSWMFTNTSNYRKIALK